MFARAHFARRSSWWDRFEIPWPDWPPRVWWALLALALAAIVVGFLARNYPQRGVSRRLARGGLAIGRDSDGWAEARALAAENRIVDALHALFASVVLALSRARQLDPHPAKTAGDYARELQHRRSAQAQRFEEFARRYERAVYGSTDVDRSMFDALESSAREAAGVGS